MLPFVEVAFVLTYVVLHSNLQAEAVSRYVGTTRMAGEIREYRNENGKVIAIAHEVRKGKTIRGQWFYADDFAAQNYVWFHSVYDLVRRAIDADDITVVDLGPSGSDAFSELKARYGFRSVADWPAVADYQVSSTPVDYDTLSRHFNFFLFKSKLLC